MVSGPSLPLTKEEFAQAWNLRFGSAEKGLRLDDWTVLQETGDVRSVQAAISDTGVEDFIWAIESSSGELSSISLAMFPNAAPQFTKPQRTGRLLQTMLNVFSQTPGQLRQFGVTLPLEGNAGLDGVNACAFFAYGPSYWVRLVQVADGGRGTYLYIRSATEQEKQTNAQQASTTERAPYAYPALNASTFAKFAPPLEAIPDLLGVERGWITPIPSSIIRLTNKAWKEPFLGSITPIPGGEIIYRVPDASGSPVYTLKNPFDAAQLAAGRDILTFVGAGQTETVPPGPQLMLLLPIIVNTPTGEGLFFLDGQRIACSWVGGTVEKPKAGLYRDAVKPLCAVEP